MSKEPFSDIESWPTQEIKWGIQGCVLEQDNVLEQMLGAESASELTKLIKKYNESEELLKRYKKVLEDRGVRCNI